MARARPLYHRDAASPAEKLRAREVGIETQLCTEPKEVGRDAVENSPARDRDP